MLAARQRNKRATHPCARSELRTRSTGPVPCPLLVVRRPVEESQPERLGDGHEPIAMAAERVDLAGQRGECLGAVAAAVVLDDNRAVVGVVDDARGRVVARPPVLCLHADRGGGAVQGLTSIGQLSVTEPRLVWTTTWTASGWPTAAAGNSIVSW